MSDKGIPETNPKACYIVPSGLVENIVNNITNMSPYAYSYQLEGGYITINGGHRVGICGVVGYSLDGKSVFKNITSINIRVCKNIMLFDDKVFENLCRGTIVCNTCIISPPGCGKTTFLKNFIMYMNRHRPDVHICVADERGELWQSEGKNVSVMSNCTKDKSSEIFTRCMSPDVAVFDEIWSESDFNAVAGTISAGVPTLFSIHGTSYDEVMQNRWFKNLAPFIQRCVQLSNRKGRGTVEYVGGVKQWSMKQ